MHDFKYVAVQVINTSFLTLLLVNFPHTDEEMILRDLCYILTGWMIWYTFAYLS
jgi:hypothetical protein